MAAVTTYNISLFPPSKEPTKSGKLQEKNVTILSMQMAGGLGFMGGAILYLTANVGLLAIPIMTVVGVILGGLIGMAFPQSDKPEVQPPNKPEVLPSKPLRGILKRATEASQPNEPEALLNEPEAPQKPTQKVSWATEADRWEFDILVVEALVRDPIEGNVLREIEISDPLCHTPESDPPTTEVLRYPERPNQKPKRELSEEEIEERTNDLLCANQRDYKSNMREVDRAIQHEERRKPPKQKTVIFKVNGTKTEITV